MSREIKFRAWDNDHKGWEYSKNMPDMGFWKWVAYDSNTIFNQYTGLKDKNGVEIYENDIVLVPYGKPVNEDGDVAYYKIMQYVPAVITYNAPFFYPKLIWGKKTISKNIPSKRQSLWMKESCEIIGNIHENPELIKGE